MGVIVNNRFKYTIGDAYVTTVEEENWDLQNDVSEKPMEDGSVVSDGVKNKLKTLKISGVIVGSPGWPVYELNIIKDHWKNGDVIDYTGVEFITHCVIQDFSYKYKDMDTGVSFDATLKEVRYASKEMVTVGVTALNIPDIEALKDQLSAQSSAKKSQIAAGIKASMGITTGRKTKKAATAKPKTTKTKKSKESVLQKIIERY